MGVRSVGVLVVLALGVALCACSSDTPAASPDASATQDLPAVKDRAVMDLPVLPDALDVTPPDAVALDTPSRDAVSEREPGTCATSADCTRDLDRRVCDTTTGRCVRCTAAEDTCPAAEHCDEALHACASGCHTDDGCVTMSGQRLRCDRARHLCVACLASADCPANTVCVGGNCTPGCDADRGCATGLTCCTRTLACINTATDVMHCGGCDRACPADPHATATCAAGACGLRCDAGFGDCNGRADDGCETDVQTTATHCGRCGGACTSAQMCAMGACVTTCPTGQTACGTACVELPTDARHCGMCDRACPGAASATATCTAGGCGLRCDADRGDCDRDTTNGCETDTRTSDAHCGACGRACAAGQRCSAGACVSVCTAGQTLCAGRCVDVASDAAHCGMCDRACAAGEACAGGRCAPSLTISGNRNLSTDSLTPGRMCGEAFAAGVRALGAMSATLGAEPPAGCLAPGDLVMLINLQGAPGATFNIGHHELLTVASVTGAEVTFRTPKVRRYGAGRDDDTNIGAGAGQQRVVLQRVPVFGDVTVAAGATLTVSAWDGQRGGVLAMRARRLAVDGDISVVARGYRNGAISVDDGSCSDNLATERGESIEGPPVVTLSASAGASGGVGPGGPSFNSNTPLQASAGHATMGEPGQNPNGRALGAPGGTYGVNDGTRLTLGSGAGGNMTCRGGSFAPFLEAAETVSGGILALWADAIVLNASGSLSASGRQYPDPLSLREAPSGGYVLLRANTLSLGSGRATARGSPGEIRGGIRNRGGDGYVVIYSRDPVSGTTLPAATVRMEANPI